MDKIKEFVEEYQCPGCVVGGDASCYAGETDSKSITCSKHVSGTIEFPAVGSFFLGMPKGFNRIGSAKELKLYIFNKLDDGWGFDKFNVPVWKYLDEHGNTIVRGLSPRINSPFLHIFIGNHIDKIDCFKITNEDIKAMD